MTAPSSAASEAGHSLLEVMISSALLFVVLGCALAAWMAGIRLERRSQLQLDMEADALRALRSMTEELAESSYNQVAWVGNELLVFPSPRRASGVLSTDLSGRITWPKTVAFRVAQEGGEPSLVRQESSFVTPASSPVQPLSLQPAQDVLFWSSLAFRPVARGVTHMDLGRSGINGQRGTIDVLLYFRRSVDNRVYRLRTRTSVAPRN